MSFFDYRSFPAIVPLVDELRARHADLAAEAMAGVDCFSPSPEYRIMAEQRLFILPARWQRKRIDQAADYNGWRPSVPAGRLASASELLAGLTDHPLVVNAMYSMSMPGCEIVPHIDNESAIGDVLRLHVGLRCPAGDCALIVAGERREWRDGEALLFDSARVIHSAHNRTSKCRMIAIIDLSRSVLAAQATTGSAA